MKINLKVGRPYDNKDISLVEKLYLVFDKVIEEHDKDMANLPNEYNKYEATADVIEIFMNEIEEIFKRKK
jgi:hypothetical protein